MASIRDTLKEKPWIGYVLIIALFAGAGYFFIKANRPRGAYSPERLREKVTIRFSDTKEEITMGRGDFERQLRLQSTGLIDPNMGLLNPKTNQYTGILVDTDGWNQTVNRINEERRKLGSVEVTRSKRPDAPVQALPADGSQPPAAPGAPTAPEAPPAPK